MSDIDPKTQSTLIATAHLMADAARTAILPHFRAPGLGADNKDQTGYDPVTEADRAAERAMRAVLAQHRPEDSVLGEEYGSTAGSTGLTWVLDPIDGTRGFISGTPTWGVLIAVGGEAGPELGIIDQPYIGERFFGGFGQAYCDGPHGRVELWTKSNTDLAKAIVFTTFPEVGTAQDRAGFEAVAKKVQLTRYGMDCYAYALVASGQVDLVIEASLNAYDIQGPIGVVQAAGGIVTDWNGGPAHQGGQAIAAANADIHTAAIALLKPFAT